MTDQNDDAPPAATPEWRDQDEGADAAADRTFNPSTQQVNRSREQGLGVGGTEINAQRDPSRHNSADGVRTPVLADADVDGGESLDGVRDSSEGGDR